jgi:hypothetical protein
MGWYYHLTLECQVLPEFYDFIRNEYLYKYTCAEYDYDQKEIAPQEGEIPAHYEEFIKFWIESGIGQHFEDYTFSETGEFRCVLVKKVNRHPGDLETDYLYFVKKVLVPITSTISFCQIVSDDFLEFTHQYKDSYLRKTESLGIKYKPSNVTIFD